MSYIYEALKRAEEEHKRGAVTVRAVGRTLFSGRPRWWVWLLISVLGANVVVLAMLAVTLGSRSPGARTTESEQREAIDTGKLASSATLPPGAPVESARVVEPAPPPQPPSPVAPATRAEPEKRLEPPRRGRARDAAQPTAPRIERQPAGASPRKMEPGLEQYVPAHRPPVTSEKAPELENVAVPADPAETVQPPKITLQVVVYSEVPSQRMVFIEGRRYAEGDTLDSETVLERITADGVVVKRRGVRFMIVARH